MHDTCHRSPCKAYLAQLASHSEYLDGSLSFDYGFSPRLQLVMLPASYAPWEQIARQLPALALSGDTQKRFDQLQVLPADANHLPDEHLKRAAIILGLFAAAYWRYGIDRLFQLRNSDIDDYLPDAILQPWTTVCQRLGRQRPFQSVADLMLNNFTFIDSEKIRADGWYELDEVRVENIRNLIPAFGNDPERIFYGTFVEVHAVTSPMIAEICAIQDHIMEAGPDACEHIIASLTRINTCINKATKALLKINPRANSLTYCDPMEWAKTIALFNIPPASYVGPLSGSASPFDHVMNAFLGRRQFKSSYGQFSKNIREQYISNKLRRFLSAVQKVSLRRYIEGLRTSDRKQFTRLSAAFNKLVDDYAGEHGFLSRHIAKALNYLYIGTLLGRNQSTSGDERYTMSKTWINVASGLKISAYERISRSTGLNHLQIARNSIAAMHVTTDADNVSLSVTDVALHRHTHDAWMIIGDGVYDMSSYTRRHLGGGDILLASVGRDATYEFEMVSGHFGNRSIDKMLRSMKVGVLKQPSQNRLPNQWYKILDYLLLVRNAFRIEHQRPSQPLIDVAYRGLSYFQFCQESLGYIIGLLRISGMVGTVHAVDELYDVRQQLARQFKQYIKDVVSGARTADAAQTITAIETSSLGLLDQLIELCCRFIDRYQRSEQIATGEESQLIADITGLIANWLKAEQDKWRELGTALPHQA